MATTVDKKVKKKAKFEDKVSDYVNNLFGVADLSGIGTDQFADRPDDYDPFDRIEAESEFDLVKLVGKAIDPLTGVPRDIKLPEGDFKEAKNFFDFCTSFRGADAKFPFSRQMWLMLSLFGEMCPRCTPKSRIQSILNTPVALDGHDMINYVQLTEYGVCPRCGGHKSDFIRSRELNEYVEMNLCIGQRAGKSTTTAAGTEYLTHKYLMYPRLAGVCRGVSSATPLVATFVGFRFSDAAMLLWKPVIDAINDSPWFQEYHKMLDHYGELHGMEFYRQKDEYLRYAHKNLEMAPMGPSKRGLRGRTRWLSCIDELGWFPIADAVKKGGNPNDDDGRERASADGVYDALDRSLLTLREEFSYLYSKGHNRFLQAYAINVSSPSSQADKITRLVEENKDSVDNLALRLPTWEISPFLPRDSKRIVNAYRKDPVAAERDYGANPPLNAAAFIMQEDAERSFVGPNRATVTPMAKRINNLMRQGGKIETSGPPAPCLASLMSLDAGLTNNSFAVTILQLQELVTGKKESIVVSVPVVLEIMPKKGHKLHYPMIYKNVLKPLIKDFNVRYLFADRWNSITTLDTAMEDFTDVKLIADQYSVKYADFVQTKSYAEEGKIILPKLEMDGDKIRRVDSYPEYFLGKPAAHLLFQMITVKDMGKTVVKGDGYTDDIFRALVLGVSRILDDKIKPEILRMSALVTRPRITGAIGAGRSTPAGMISNPVHTFAVGSTTTRMISDGRPYASKNSTVVRVGRS